MGLTPISQPAINATQPIATVTPVITPEVKSVVTPEIKPIVAPVKSVITAKAVLASVEQTSSPIAKLTPSTLPPRNEITSKTPLTTNPTTNAIPLPPSLPPVIKAPALTQQHTSAVTPPPFKITGLQFEQGKAGLKKVTTRESSPIVKSQSGPQPITPMIQVQATRTPILQSKSTGVSMDELKAKLQSRKKL